MIETNVWEVLAERHLLRRYGYIPDKWEQWEYDLIGEEEASTWWQRAMPQEREQNGHDSTVLR